MIEQSSHEEFLSVIKELKSDPALTQRAISEKLGISLGKTNYLIKQLINKGFIKARHFSNNPYKLKKINYILTSKGIQHMIKLTRLYLDKKAKEYNKLKKDWKRVRSIKI